MPPIIQIWIICSFVRDAKGMKYSDWSSLDHVVRGR